MNYHQASQSTTMAAILRPMFIALPLPRGIDADDLLRGYLVALETESVEALKSVVVKLAKGTWHEEIKFCPRPPELANMVRDEKRRIDLLNEPKRLASPVRTVPFHDGRPGAREQMMREGRRMLADDLTLAAYQTRARASEFPAGSVYSALLGEVWGPRS